MDLAIISKWKQLNSTNCPGCGRPLSQHLNNPSLGREETKEDYTPYTMNCPAMESIATGQSEWRRAHEKEINDHYRRGTPDPTAGVFWLSKGPNEVLPD